MNEERTPTGIDGLDALIEGGFQSGSLILLAGGPGSGKTVFGAQFLGKGIGLGEVGVYVSFAEDKETFVRNMSRHLGQDFEKYVQKGECRFLKFATVEKAGISNVLEKILTEVIDAKAKRLVVDSYTAIVRASKEKMEARIITHTILERLVRQLECTAVLISEITPSQPVGEEDAEFLADGLIRLRTDEVNGRLLRELEIVKLRGTRIPERRLVFTLEGGFVAFPPFKAKPIEKRERFKPITDQPEKFSTGSQELDRLLNGGYPKGSTVLIEVEEQVSTFQYQLILYPSAFNFMAKGRACIVIPPSGVDYNVVKAHYIEAGFTEDEVNRLVRVCASESSSPLKEPYIARLGGQSVQEDYRIYLKTEEELVNETGQPVLRMTSVDSAIAQYSREAATRILNLDATRIREKGSLGLLILKPNYTELSNILGAIADVHLKVTSKHGTLILYGAKPRTNLHEVEIDASKGYPLPKLTPIV